MGQLPLLLVLLLVLGKGYSCSDCMSAAWLSQKA
jgi:hypothetical protein